MRFLVIMVLSIMALSVNAQSLTDGEHCYEGSGFDGEQNIEVEMTLKVEGKLVHATIDGHDEMVQVELYSSFNGRMEGNKLDVEVISFEGDEDIKTEEEFIITKMGLKRTKGDYGFLGLLEVTKVGCK